MSPNTISLHRVLRAPAERIYQAFLNPAAMVKWLPPFGFTGTMHEMEACVGGSYRMSFTHFASGNSHSFTGRYITLEPGKLIEYANSFEDESLNGEMFVTIRLKSVLSGTELSITQAGIPVQIPLGFCYLGWQESLLMLAQLVEVEIPTDN